MTVAGFGRVLALVLATSSTACFFQAPSSCFVAGTRVRTPRGSRPIEELAVGDEVLAFDPATMRVNVRAITHVLRATSDHFRGRHDRIAERALTPARSGRVARQIARERDATMPSMPFVYHGARDLAGCHHHERARAHRVCPATQCDVARAPNRLMTEYFRQVPSSARRSDDNCSCQFEEEQRCDAIEFVGKTTEATCSVL
jgi:hypothetical protein